MTTPKPSRRTFLASGSAGAIFAALSAAAAYENCLVAAIERHKAALAALDAREYELSKCDQTKEFILSTWGQTKEFIDAEHEALMALARTPCVDDRQLMAKLRYLLANRKQYYRPGGWRGLPAPEVLTAIDLHLGGAGSEG